MKFKFIAVPILIISLGLVSYYYATNDSMPSCQTSKKNYDSGFSNQSEFKLSIAHLSNHKRCEFEKLSKTLENKSELFSNCPMLKKKTPVSCLMDVFKRSKVEATVEVPLRALLINKAASSETRFKENKLKSKYVVLKSLLDLSINTSYQDLYFVKHVRGPGLDQEMSILAMLTQISIYNSVNKKLIQTLEKKLQKLSEAIRRAPASSRDVKSRHLAYLAKKIEKLKKVHNYEKIQTSKIYKKYDFNL